MKLKFFSGLMLASGLASAAAPIDGWYSNVFGAFAWVPGNIHTINHSDMLWDNAHYKWGYDVGGAIGFKSYPLRYELQYTYVKADARDFLLDLAPADLFKGYTSASLGMVNVYYDFPEMLPAISPYVGVGLGYGYITTALSGFDELDNDFHFLKITDNAFAWQITGGLTYNFAENFAVNVDYRYANTSNLDVFNKSFQTHLIEVGATYRFDDMRYK